MTQPRQQQAEAAFLAAMAAYQARSAALRARLAQIVAQAWRRLGEYRQPQMRLFTQQIVPIVTGAQQQMAALTAANLAQQRQIALGGTGTPVAVDARAVTGSAARNGADPAEVYGRPFHLVWRQLDELPHEPGSIDQAIQAGLDRATELAVDDMQLAKQHTALQILSHDDQVVGYRRVLEGTYSCGLCIVASTQRYHKDKLLPIHGRCDCSVAAIYGKADPGRIIEAAVRRPDGTVTPVAELADVHDRIEQRFGRSSSAARLIPRSGGTQYRDVLIAHEHNELGSVLAVRDASHKSLAELQASGE